MTRGPHYRMVKTLLSAPKPIVAALNGRTHGAGWVLALACDFRVARDDALIGDIRSGKAIYANQGVGLMLPHLIGASRAMDLLMTGRVIEAAEAERFGIVQRLWPAADWDRELQAFVHELAVGPDEGLRGLEGQREPGGADGARRVHRSREPAQRGADRVARSARRRRVVPGEARPGVHRPLSPAGQRSGQRSLGARIRVPAVVPGHCVRLRRGHGGQLAVADLYRQLRDRRDLGDLERRCARDLGLGRIQLAEVPE